MPVAAGGGTGVEGHGPGLLRAVEEGRVVERHPRAAEGPLAHGQLVEGEEHVGDEGVAGDLAGGER